MRHWTGVALVALLIAACKAPLRPDRAISTPGSVEELAAAVALDSRRSDGETDSKAREELASDASRHADTCLERAPQAAACLYAHALALGLQARAHPLHAGDLLKSMLESLSNAEAVDPEYDEAGPARVRARRQDYCRRLPTVTIGCARPIRRCASESSGQRIDEVALIARGGVAAALQILHDAGQEGLQVRRVAGT